MPTLARTSAVLSPLANHAPRELKALVSLAHAIRERQRMRREEDDFDHLSAELRADIGYGPADLPAFVPRRPAH